MGVSWTSCSIGVDGWCKLKFSLVFLPSSCPGFRWLYKVTGYWVDLAGSEVRSRLISHSLWNSWAYGICFGEYYFHGTWEMSIECISRHLRSLETSIWRIKLCVFLSHNHCLYCFGFYLSPFLLDYNSYTMKFTLLKFIVQWFLVYWQSCATFTAISFQNIFITP